MKKFIWIVLMLVACGCATTQRKPHKVVLWSDVQKVMNNPYMVDEILLKQHNAWPQRETRITEKANKQGDVLWVYDHVKWGRLAPGLNIRTIQCLKHYKETERRRWLSYLSMDVGMFASYLRLTKQRIPPEMMLNPREARDQYGSPTSDTVSRYGDGHIVWSMVSEPPYDLRSNVRMQFKRGILTHIEFGELEN